MAKTENVTLAITDERLEQLTLDQMIAFEDAQHDGREFRALRELLIMFVSTDNGEYLEEGEARAAVGKWSLVQIREATAVLMDGIKTSSVRPTRGGS